MATAEHINTKLVLLYKDGEKTIRFTFPHILEGATDANVKSIGRAIADLQTLQVSQYLRVVETELY